MTDCANGCGFLLAYYLQIEYAGVSTMIDLMTPRWAILPSVHHGLLGITANAFRSGWENGYGFFDRLFMLTIAIVTDLVIKKIPNLSEQFSVDLNISLSPYEIASKSSLFFINYEPLLSGDPLPEQPNLLLTGGIGTEPAREIKDTKLKEFVDGAKEGVIIFSMGSVITAVPIDIVVRVLRVMANLDQKMVMRLHPAYQEKLKDGGHYFHND